MTQDFLQQREVWFPWNWWKIRNCREICFKICFDKKIAKRCCLFKALKIMHKTPCWQIRYHISFCAKTIYRFSKYIFLSKPLRNFACFEFYKLILKHFLSSIIKVHLVYVEEIDNILFQKRKNSDARCVNGTVLKWIFKKTICCVVEYFFSCCVLNEKYFWARVELM